MKFSCIIIDDEPLAHEVLKKHLEKIKDIDLVGSFFNGIEAGKYLADYTVDIMLVDIQMPELNGLDFIRSLSKKPVSIITTAHRDYAFEGFELGVIDYLLKPIIFDRFEIALKRATDFLRLENAANTIDFAQGSSKNFEIQIKTGTKRILLDYRTINYAQGLKDYTILYTDTTKYLVKGSVKAFEEFLPKDYFMRVHKSFIIALSKIKSIHKNKIELGSISIPIGRLFRPKTDAFFNLHKSKDQPKKKEGTY